MARPKLSTVLIAWLDGQWEQAQFDAWHREDGTEVQIRGCGWTWTGFLTDRQWHDVMSAGVNELGRTPLVRFHGYPMVVGG